MSPRLKISQRCQQWLSCRQLLPRLFRLFSPKRPNRLCAHTPVTMRSERPEIELGSFRSLSFIFIRFLSLYLKRTFRAVVVSCYFITLDFLYTVIVVLFHFLMQPFLKFCDNLLLYDRSLCSVIKQAYCHYKYLVVTYVRMVSSPELHIGHEGYF